MNKVFDIGKFDLDITLRDAALDPNCRPTKRMLANASIGVEPFDAYYSARELYETLQGVFQSLPNAKARLTQILSCHCDDYQRCLYYALAEGAELSRCSTISNGSSSSSGRGARCRGTFCARASTLRRWSTLTSRQSLMALFLPAMPTLLKAHRGISIPLSEG